MEFAISILFAGIYIGVPAAGYAAFRMYDSFRKRKAGSDIPPSPKPEAAPLDETEKEEALINEVQAITDEIRVLRKKRAELLFAK